MNEHDVLCLGGDAEARDAAERNETMMNTISYEAVVADLEAHPKKRIFWRSGGRTEGRGSGR